jgi:hypothetical protein
MVENCRSKCSCVCTGRFIFNPEVEPADLAKALKPLLDERIQQLSQQSDVSALLNKLYIHGLELLQTDLKDNVTARYKVGGVYLLDAVMAVNDDSNSSRRIDVSNNIRKLIFENERLNLEFSEPVVRAGAMLIGHFARISSAPEIEFLQRTYLDLFFRLIVSLRADHLRYAGAVISVQLSINSPSLVFGKRREVLARLWDAVGDKNSAVRLVAAEALEVVLQLISQREAISEYLTNAIKIAVSGFTSTTATPDNSRVVGSLLILSILISGKIIKLELLKEAIQKCGMLIEDFVWHVLQLFSKKLDLEARNLVVSLTPPLASAFSKNFISSNKYIPQSGTFLQYSVKQLLAIVKSKRDAAVAFVSLGQLFSYCVPLRTSTLVEEIFGAVIEGFADPYANAKALECLGMIVQTSLPSRRLIDRNVIDAMFRGGLSQELMYTLRVIVKYVPKETKNVQFTMRTELTNILLRYAVVVDDVSDRQVLSARAYMSPQTAAAQSLQTPLEKQFPSTSSSSLRPLASAVSNGVLVGPAPVGNAPKPAALPKAGSWFFHHTTESTATTPTTQPFLNPHTQILLAMRMLSSCADIFDDETSGPGDSGNSKAAVVGVGPMGDGSVTKPHSQLLVAARDGLARYLEDSNETVRCTAALTSMALFDHVIPKVDSRSSDFSLVQKVLERLLLMTVGDDSNYIRWRILSSFPPRLDAVLAVSQHVGCLTEALNDESLDIRVASMSVLSRVAHFDLLRIMPVIRLSVTNLVKQLHYSRFLLRKESIQLLEALVRGANTLIVPYVNQVLEPLIMLLDESAPDTVGIILSTIGELALASPENIMPYIERLFPRLIDALNSETSLSTREIAVMAMGKLVASLTLLTDVPYAKFPELFTGLVSAIQCEDEGAQELRLQAIRTMGLLGAVEQIVHQSRLRRDAAAEVDAFSQDYIDDAAEGGASGSVSDDGNIMATIIDSRPSAAPIGEVEKDLKKSEKFNFSVVLRELTRIIEDSALSVHHLLALQTAVKAVRYVGTRSFPFVDGLVKAMIVRMKSQDTGITLKDQILDSFANMIYIIGRPMRAYQSSLVEILAESLPSHLQTCLDLVEACYVVFSSGHFQTFFGEVIPSIISLCRDETLEVTRTATDQALQTGSVRINGSGGVGSKSSGRYDMPTCVKVLQTIANIRAKLGHFRKQLVHLVMSILNNVYVNPETRKFALCVCIHVADDNDLREYANRIIHPIIRVITTATAAEMGLLQAAVISLSTILCRTGIDYLPFVLPVRRVIKAQTKEFQRLPQVEEYEQLIVRLLQLKPLPTGPHDIMEISVAETTTQKVPRGNTELPFQMSYQALETAWALADRDSQSDLIDWIERLSIELIRQCPSPIIRMCAPLTKAYKPMAEKLFNASFCCIWDELYAGESTDVIDDIPIVDSIETALKSSQVPMYIVNVLLTLAEFMGMQDKRLPIDVPLLGRQAEAANMFSKSLYYREMEFESRNISPTGECVEALISVSNELGLQERARGALAYVVQYLPHVEIKPYWLEKLHQWHEANSRYKQQNMLLKEFYPNDKPTRHPVWMASELGVMRCLLALGDYSELQKTALDLKDALKSSDVSESQQASWLVEIQSLGAKASWMLGQWGIMGQFVEGDHASQPTNDVELSSNLNFYRAVLAIHDKKYDAANQLITTSRTQILQAISSLMSENYSRAYRAMVSMQVLSEMEEVIEFKQTLERSKIELELASPKLRSASIVRSMKNAAHNISSNDLHLHAANGGGSAGPISSVASIAASARAALIRKWNGRLRSAPKEVDMFTQILVRHIFLYDLRLCG